MFEVTWHLRTIRYNGASGGLEVKSWRHTTLWTTTYHRSQQNVTALATLASMQFKAALLRQKFLYACNEHFTEVMNVQGSYHLQCTHCNYCTHCSYCVYVMKPVSLPSSSPAGFYVLWTLTLYCWVVLMCQSMFTYSVSVLNNTRQSFTYFQVKTKFSSLDAELHRFLFLFLSKLMQKL